MKIKDKFGFVIRKEYAFIRLIDVVDRNFEIKLYIEQDKFDDMNRLLKYCRWNCEEVK